MQRHWSFFQFSHLQNLTITLLHLDLHAGQMDSQPIVAKQKRLCLRYAHIVFRANWLAAQHPYQRHFHVCQLALMQQQMVSL